MAQRGDLPDQRVNFHRTAPDELPLDSAVGVPPARELFDVMAIKVEPLTQSRYIVGDNVKGYYEGWTSSYQGGGYLLGERTFFMGWASAAGGRLVNRTSAGARQKVLPWGQSTEEGGLAEDLVFHRGRRALSLRVVAPTETKLHLLAFVDWDLDNLTLTESENALVLGPGPQGALHGDPPYLAIALDRDGFISTRLRDIPETVAQDLALTGEKLTLVGGTAGTAESLTLSLAFGYSLEEARDTVLSLATTDAVNAEKNQVYHALTRSRLWTDETDFNAALLWAEASSWSFYVEEFGKGLWAGLPWFRDNWGRDTFIALPGTFHVTGHFADSRLVMENFLRYQNKGEPRNSHNAGKNRGRIPNRVSRSEILYNTADGTPLLLRALSEYIAYSGDKEFGLAVLPAVRLYLEGALEHWVDAEGLLTHHDADTWMDARILGNLAWSPRGNRSVEIQALWYQALRTAADLECWNGDPVAALKWNQKADRVREAVLRLFWDGTSMADRIRKDGSRDDKPRPNVFIAATYPLETDWWSAEIQVKVLEELFPKVVYPYGVTSLGSEHPYFHPRHEYTGKYHKDAAYHNGSLWAWLAGPVVSTAARWGAQDVSWELTRNLTDQILRQGTLGTLSENANAEPGPDGKPILTGTYSQAWSVAEFARNAYQDYLGFRPDLAKASLVLAPSLPSAWKSLTAKLAVGEKGSLHITYVRRGRTEEWRIFPGDLPPLTLVFQPLATDRSRKTANVALRSASETVLHWDGISLSVNDISVRVNDLAPGFDLSGLRFAQAPTDWGAFPVLKEPDTLQTIVESGAYR